MFVDIPRAVAEARDTKGLYRRARAGELGSGLPGLDAPYEPPERPELTLRTDLLPLEECGAAVVQMLRAGKHWPELLPPPLPLPPRPKPQPASAAAAGPRL